MIKLLLLTMFISLMPTTIAFANEKVTNVFQTTLDLANNKLSNSSITDASNFQFDASKGTITKYVGSDATVVIPREINGILVTSIGYCAFYCDNVQSITLPNSITSIGDHAFYGCSSLESIIIPESVTSIEANAFISCSSLTNITIPNSVTSIGKIAFEGCTSLTNITIPDSVTTIGDWAFHRCTSLKGVTIPNSVTRIGANAFTSCSSLTSITIPNSIINIEDSTFEGCKSLTSITIPNSVTTISSNAFYGCTSLKTATIPESITSIGYRAFHNCDNTLFYVKSEKVKQLLINSSVNQSKIKGNIILNGQSSTISNSWKQNNKGWWYTEGNSYATGWKLIDGNWYYFYSDGYMAKNTTINGYYLNSSGAWTNSVNSDDQMITFVDKNLEQVVRNQINKPTGDLYKSDVENISNLMIRNANVSTLNGIENLTNLKGLGVTDDEVYDISALSKLYNLEYVTLKSIKLKDMNYIINTLKGLPKLEHINLLGNNFVYADKQKLADAIPNAFTDYLTIGGKY